MLNRWYRKNECNGDPDYINFTYHNPANFPLVRQIQVHYCKKRKYFLTSLFTPPGFSQKKLIECYKTILTNEEFKNLIYCSEVREISINTEAIAANSELLKKIINIFAEINRLYIGSISIEVIKELENIFNYQFDKPFVSEISTWQDIPSYVNPLHESANNLVELTRRFRLYPKTINPTLYLHWLKEGENPNQKDGLGMTVLFMLSEKYSSFKEEGVEALAYKLIQILLFYGADIFFNDNGPECLSAAESLDHQGFPDIFRKIIIANIRVEKPLKIQSVEQSFANGVITTEFKFQEKTTNDIVTTLLPVDTFNQDQALIKKCYELFCQTFEAPDGSEDKVKKEFFCAFTSDKNEKIYVEIIYAKIKDNIQMIGFTIYKIFKDQQDVVLNIEYSLVDKKYRFGLMSFLDFRIAFCLSLLNPDLQSAVFFGAVHINSYEMIKHLFFSPKFNVLGAERVIKKMVGENTSIEMLKRNITPASVKVRGSYFTKPAEDIFQQMFYEFDMWFANNPAQSGQLIPPENPVAALMYVPMIFIKQMQKSAFFHGFNYFKDLIIPLVGFLPKLDASLGQSRCIDLSLSSFPKSLSLFAPPKKLSDPVQYSQQMTGIRSRL